LSERGYPFRPERACSSLHRIAKLPQDSVILSVRFRPGTFLVPEDCRKHAWSMNSFVSIHPSRPPSSRCAELNQDSTRFAHASSNRREAAAASPMPRPMLLLALSPVAFTACSGCRAAHDVVTGARHCPPGRPDPCAGVGERNFPSPRSIPSAKGHHTARTKKRRRQ
jgi:hypothetical protein